MAQIAQYAVWYVGIAFMMYLLLGASSQGNTCGIWNQMSNSSNSTSLISLVTNGATGTLNRPLTDYITQTNAIAAVSGLIVSGALTLAGAPILLVAASAIISPIILQFASFTNLVSNCVVPDWLLTTLSFIDFINLVLIAYFLAYFYSWRQF